MEVQFAAAIHHQARRLATAFLAETRLGEEAARFTTATDLLQTVSSAITHHDGVRECILPMVRLPIALSAATPVNGQAA